VSTEVVDIGHPAECRFWTQFEASGVAAGSIFEDLTDVMASQDILGICGNQVHSGVSDLAVRAQRRERRLRRC
jgi:hypothetical protein